MKFENIISNLFKEDPLTKEIKSTGILSNSLSTPFMDKSMQLYSSILKRSLEEDLIKNLLKYFEEKGFYEKKLKILTFWIQIYKETKYDLSDIMISKKIKLFSKPSPIKSHPLLNKQNADEYILYQILIPLYNYFMKLSINEDLYKHCLIGKIPENEVFRRGTKIRFIWIFKIYNLIYLLLPILESCLKFLNVFPDFKAILEISHVFYQDVLAMNNFIIEALEEGSEDNFMLMPYFDLLQFYESLAQEPDITIKINNIFSGLLPHEEIKPEKPRILSIDPETMADIRTQVARVKLISFSLKNPKKDCTSLMTEYESEVIKEKDRILKTEMNEPYEKRLGEDFEMKYKFIDE